MVRKCRSYIPGKESAAESVDGQRTRMTSSCDAGRGLGLGLWDGAMEEEEEDGAAE